MKTRGGLQGDAKGDAVIHRLAAAVVNYAKGQRGGPTAHIAIEAVILFLQSANVGVEILRGAKAPVFVQAVKERASNDVVARIHKSIVQIPMAQPQAPAVVGRKGQLMEGQIQMIVIDA